MVYAHIHDEALRKEIEKYHESRVVNFQGETAELDETILSSNDDLEWFKKNVQARALEHGYCARPKVLGDCNIPGFDGCYNCPHWRTNKNFLPILKDTLERTNNVLEKARNCGWQLQVNKNTPIKENLDKVIKTLEADNAIEQGWKPNGKIQIKSELDLFTEWYPKAKLHKLVQASQTTKDGIMIYTNDEKWIPFSEMLTQYPLETL